MKFHEIWKKNNNPTLLWSCLFATTQPFTTSDESIYDSVMAAHGVSFESSSSIDERKASKRQARQEAIEKV